MEPEQGTIDIEVGWGRDEAPFLEDNFLNYVNITQSQQFSLWI
jgi:hypothetical protein